MSTDLIKVSKRIAREMARMQSTDPVVKNDKTLALFMGLGMALACCFEQATGERATTKKPYEILKWALDLPLDGEKRIVLQ